MPKRYIPADPAHRIQKSAIGVRRVIVASARTQARPSQRSASGKASSNS